MHAGQLHEGQKVITKADSYGGDLYVFLKRNQKEIGKKAGLGIPVPMSETTMPTCSKTRVTFHQQVSQRGRLS